jgi:hypothetical protein
MSAEHCCACDDSGNLCPGCNQAPEDADRSGFSPVFPPRAPVSVQAGWDRWAKTHEFDIQCD